MNIEMKIATKMPKNISNGNYTEMDSSGLKVTIKVHHFGRQPRARRYEILANKALIIHNFEGSWCVGICPNFRRIGACRTIEKSK